MSSSLGAAGSIQHRVDSEMNSILTDFLIDLNCEHVGLVVRVFFPVFIPQIMTTYEMKLAFFYIE